MADVTVPSLKRATPINGPYGNVCHAHVKQAVDLAQNDVWVAIRLPRGCRIVDCIFQTSALGASTTASVGIRAVNSGSKGNAAALIAAGADVSAAIVLRRNKTGVYTDGDLYLDDDDYDVIATLAGANPASNGVYELQVFYTFVGTL